MSLSILNVKYIINNYIFSFVELSKDFSKLVRRETWFYGGNVSIENVLPQNHLSGMEVRYPEMEFRNWKKDVILTHKIHGAVISHLS